MEDLDFKYANFVNAHLALTKAISTQERLQKLSMYDTDVRDVFVAGIIQHFELTYETCWKFLKQYLFEKFGKQVLSPRAVFKESYDLGLFPKDLFDELIKLLEVRNLTTHIYDRLFAQEVGDDILKHHKALGQIIDLITLPERLE